MPAESTEQKTCFIAMPISTRPAYLERYGGREDHFEQILKSLFIPAVEAAGYFARPPARSGTTNIQAEIINDLEGSDMVLMDMSTLNENVFFELGMRTALDKPMCLVWDGHDRLPFDTNTINALKYNPQPVYELNSEIAKVAEHLAETTAASLDGRNPLWKYFGTAASVGADLKPAALVAGDGSTDAKLDAILSLVARQSSAQESFDGASDTNPNPIPALNHIVELSLAVEGFEVVPGSIFVEGDGDSTRVHLKGVDETTQQRFSSAISREFRRRGLEPQPQIVFHD